MTSLPFLGLLRIRLHSKKTITIKHLNFIKRITVEVVILLHPEILLTKGRAQYSDKEVAEYVGVASFRNYYEYKRTGNKTLDLIHCPVSQDTINENRLLDIRDGCIHFLFEETKGEINGDWIQSN